MPIDNESTIGVNRPDGTAKLERDAFSRFASFFAAAAPYLDDFAPEPVALVVPYARLFSGRQGGIDHTKRLVRLLAERHGVVPQALPDIRLTAEQLRGVKLAIVPAPEMLDEDAAAGAPRGVEVGNEGPDHRPDRGGLLRPGDSVAAGARTSSARADRWPSTRRRRGARLAGKTQWVTFENLAQHWLERGTKASPAALAGAVWHEPLPLDFARETEPLDALLVRGAEGGRRRHAPGAGTASRPGCSSPRRPSSSSASTRRRPRRGGGWWSKASRSRSRSRPSARGSCSSRGGRAKCSRPRRAREWPMSTTERIVLAVIIVGVDLLVFACR